MEFDNNSFEVQQQRKNSKDNNTEYVPTRCRITKPAPPKPATNPMQFVKVPSCPLYKKAQEQLKKAEEVKTVRQEVREEAEDWQMNLDNWKSSRRKIQEHIIERVVEVKKLEQEEQERGRRKTKTFNEMMEERNKRRQLSLPLYENDDSNDLSDYGIGSSSSKTDSIKDVDTDDSSSVLDDKEQNLSPESSKEMSEVYTYEGAIQDYRSRTKNLNNLTHQFSKSSECLSDMLINDSKRSLFDIQLDTNKSETNLSQRFSEDFAQSQSIKERLLSLEKFTEQPLKIADFVKNKSTSIEPTIPIKTIIEVQECNLPMDTDTPTTEICSISIDTDPEDSGIHTTDVSCSVSQADESVEDTDASSISHYVEKLTFEDEPASPVPPMPVPIYDSFPLMSTSSIEPPKEKPPPPPPLEDLDTTKRIKNEIHIKRWSFLGLEEPVVEQFETELAVVLPEVNKFREQEKMLYKKVLDSRDSGHSEDSGVELDKNKEIWFRGPGHEEDEISKKEREIIEMVEKEEQWRGNPPSKDEMGLLSKSKSCSSDALLNSNQNTNRIAVIRSDNNNMDYKFDDDVLKLEHELLQLEKEDMIRQRSRANSRHRYSLDNINMKDLNTEIVSPSLMMMDHRKSMPEPIPPGKPLRLVMPQAYQTPPRVQNRKPLDYNQHWLIQEAEQRRLNSQRMKHIPDNVIQTLTQRVQNRATLRSYPTLGHAQPLPMYDESPDKMLSVSGKKKCSYCNNELGRGAAMIIESLCLFYHMECFKCCVCHMQLGDGLMGTDVRVRNQKLHCHNCYSSDDGLKFSCV